LVNPRDETGRTSRDAGAPPSPPRVLLLEPHPDHAEIAREALERAWPGADVRTRPQEAGTSAVERFDLLVCSTAAIDDARRWLSRFEEGAPPVVLIADAEHPPRPMDGARVAAVLDKRNARGFVERLAGAAASALHGSDRAAGLKEAALPRPAVPRAAPGATPAPDPPRAALAPETGSSAGDLLSPRTYDGGALDESPSERDRRAEALAAGMAQALAGFLEHAAPLAELAARRAARDPVLTGYLGGFAAELGRARGLAARLARLLGEPPALARRTMRAADFVTLRAGAWRGWLPDEIALRLAVDPGPLVAVEPELIAPSLDDLVQALAPAADPPCGIDVGVAPVRLGAEFVASHPGARAGRFARIALAAARGHVPRVEPLPGPVPAGEPALQAALAAAKAHGGYLELRWDPARRHLDAADLYLPEAERVPRASGVSTAPASILLVDDDASVRETVVALLEGAGWRSLAVPSGAAALDLYRAGCRYGLVLLDLLMPGLSGAETFRRLRALDPAVRVVVASGSRPGEPLRRMLAEGALGFLAKPFGLAELVAIVEAATGSRPPAPSRS
jgi:CheY-like chemotaxis protein